MWKIKTDNGNEYHVDKWTIMGNGITKLADDIVDMIKEHDNSDFSIAGDKLAVRDILKKVVLESMAYGGHTYGDITPLKAKKWLELFEDLPDMYHIVDLDDMNEVAKQIKNTIEYNTAYEVNSDYSDTYPHLDFDVWDNDLQEHGFGIRVFYFIGRDNLGNKVLKRSPEFYGYIYGDDSIYEDLTVIELQKALAE